jgi:hypothetical protein
MLPSAQQHGLEVALETPPDAVWILAIEVGIAWYEQDPRVPVWIEAYRRRLRVPQRATGGWIAGPRQIGATDRVGVRIT